MWIRATDAVLVVVVAAAVVLVPAVVAAVLGGAREMAVMMLAPARVSLHAGWQVLGSACVPPDRTRGGEIDWSRGGGGNYAQLLSLDVANHTHKHDPLRTPTVPYT